VPETGDETSLIELRLTTSGGVRVFSGRGSDDRPGQRIAMEPIITGLALRAVEAVRVVATTCDFRGDWDLGLAVTNLRGTVSSVGLMPHRMPPYPDEEFRKVLRVTPAELASDSLELVQRLTDHLDRVLNGRRFDLTKSR